MREFLKSVQAQGALNIPWEWGPRLPNRFSLTDENKGLEVIEAKWFVWVED